MRFSFNFAIVDFAPCINYHQSMTKNTPVPTGKYAVGTLTYTVKNDRPEVMASSKMRSVASRVYYPVLKKSVENLTKARYMSREMARGVKKTFLAPLNYDKLEAEGKNTSECYENAEKIPGEKFPLIVFNHGYFSYREANSFLCIELASHGYVVVSVAHSMEGICTEFDEETDDGKFVLYDKRITKKTYEPFWRGVFAALKVSKAKGTHEELSCMFDDFQNKYCRFLQGRLDEWVKDTKAALDYAKKNLSDLIDFEMGIGAAGHSFGGDVAYKLCTSDPDFVCGVNIDGALFGDYKDTVLQKPFMQISGNDNENIVSRVYLHHSKPVYKVLFKDMKHMGFCDMKYYVPMKSTVGKLQPEAMHENLCKCHIEFFDAFLKRKKAVPNLINNDAVTVSVFEPDLTLPELQL